MNKVILFIGLLLVQVPLWAQVDSLLKALNTSDEYSKGALYSALADFYYQNEEDSTLYYCLRAQNVYDSIGTISDKAYIHSFLGVVYKNLDSYDSSIIHLGKAVEFHALDTFARGVAANYVNLGNVYTLKGDYDLALQNFYEALTIFQNEKDTINIATSHANIGEVLLKLNELDKARDHLLLSKQQYQYEKDRVGEAWINYYLGLLSMKKDEVDEADTYFDASQEIWNELERRKEYLNCYLRKGELYLTTNYQKSKQFFLKAEQGFIDMNHKIGLSETYLLLGKLSFQFKNYAESISYFTRSLRISNEIKNIELKLEVYNNLYLANKYLGNTSQSLNYLEKFRALKDSMDMTNRDKTIVEYETKLNVLTKENIIEKLKDSSRIQQLENSNLLLENEQSKYKNGQQKIGLYVLAGGIIVILIVVLLLKKQNTLKTRLNEQLEDALKEREVLIREVHHRVKNNLQIVASLLNLQNNQVDKKSAEEILKLSQSRVEAMSIIHEKLYQSEKLNSISFKEYIDNLATYLTESFGNENIRLVTDVYNVNLPIDQLVPCGLIINELVTNAYKHAFEEGQKGQVVIKVGLQENFCVLSILDNGIGFPKDFDTKTSRSLGIRLVKGLVKQIKGDIILKKEESWHGYEIQFPVSPIE